MSSMGVPVTVAALLLLTGAAPGEGVPAAIDDLRALEAAFREAAREVAPSVVAVVVERADRKSTRRMRNAPRGRIGARRKPPRVPATALGTGLIVHPRGLVLTSTYFTTGRLKRVLVLLPDGTPYRADVLGRDEGREVVLLRIRPRRPLPVPRFVEPSKVRVGQWVCALGRTYGEVEPSMNVGIISALGRIGGRAIQTDTAISPINYGGPLIDLEGRVIGICTPLSPNPRIPGTAFYDSGIGFAVPVLEVMRVLPLLAKGKVLRPGFLGIRFDVERVVEGALIKQVLPNTAAHRAGLRPGDVILALDGRRVRSGFDLMNRIGRRYASERVRLRVRRGKRVFEVEVVLGARPTAPVRSRRRVRPRSSPSRGRPRGKPR